MTILSDYSLKKLNTFNIDVKAAFFCEINSIDDLVSLARDRKMGNNFLVIGGGSNILFTKDFNGLVIKNNLKGIEIVGEDDENVIIKAGAGEVWDDLVKFSVENSFYGIENLSLIPGTVGAAPIQNIGAYGVEQKDTIIEVEYFDIKKCSVEKISKENCRFGYRDSIFKNELKGNTVVLSIKLKLSKEKKFNLSYKALADELKKSAENLSLLEVRKKIIEIRESKLPSTDIMGNVGSFFKNPEINRAMLDIIKNKYPDVVYYEVNSDFVKIPAGWLIEKAGLKGYRKGDTGTYPKQALILINYGNASGREILELAEEIIEKVKNKFGIELVPEVNII